VKKTDVRALHPGLNFSSSFARAARTSISYVEWIGKWYSIII